MGGRELGTPKDETACEAQGRSANVCPRRASASKRPVESDATSEPTRRLFRSGGRRSPTGPRPAPQRSVSKLIDVAGSASRRATVLRRRELNWPAEADTQQRPAAGGVLRFGIPPARLSRLAHDRQPEAGPRELARPVGAVEAVEHER